MLQKPQIEYAFRVALCALPLCLFLVTATSVSADCRAPHYRQGHVWEDSASKVMLNISIKMGDFAPERLVCLAQSLKQHHSNRKKISILIFSSHGAAKYYNQPFGGDSFKPRVNWSLQEHAYYSFDQDKDEDVVYLMPFGEDRHFETRINLSVTSIPPCTLRMSDRCLLAADKPQYPWDALKTNVSGTVTLTGTIARDGKMTDVRVAEATVTPSTGSDQLVNPTLRNLQTWQFEPEPRMDPIRITYSYRVVNPPGLGGTVQVQFDLPREIVIEGKP